MPVTNSSAFVHSCGSFTNFLDLQCTLQNNLSGTPTIFIGVMAFAMLILGAWLRLPLFAIGMGIVLLGAILSPISMSLFVITWFVALILIGFQIGKSVIR